MIKTIGFLFLALSPAAGAGNAEQCLHDIAQVVEKPVLSRESVSHSAAETLGRKLNKKEESALLKARGGGGYKLYTPAEIVEQERLLTKAGFRPLEITEMRKRQLLANSYVSVSNGAPAGIETKKIALKQLSSGEISELKDGKKLQYVIADDGNLYINAKPIHFAKNKITLGIEDANGREIGRVIREAGELSHNKNGFSFRPVYGSEITAADTEKISQEMARVSPGAKISHSANKAVPQARAAQCLDILSSQSSGKNMLLDRLITENSVLVGGVVAAEAMGGNRLNNENGRQVVLADLIGTNVLTVFGSTVYKRLSMGNVSFTQAMAVRTGVIMAGADIQKGIHETVVQKNSEATAEELANFNRAYSLSRIPVNQAFDKFLVSKLPVMIFNHCMKNPTGKILISPRSVRMGERVASTVLYYGLRQSVTGN